MLLCHSDPSTRRRGLFSDVQGSNGPDPSSSSDFTLPGEPIIDISQYLHRLDFFTGNQHPYYHLPLPVRYASPLRGNRRVVAPVAPATPSSPRSLANRASLPSQSATPSAPMQHSPSSYQTPPSSPMKPGSSSLPGTPGQLSLFISPNDATPVKIQNALQENRLMMKAYDPASPVPSTIQTRMVNGVIQHVYPLDPVEIKDEIKGHIHDRNQLAWLLLYTYKHLPIPVQVKRPEKRTTFQFGHAIHSDYSAAHPSCTPRMEDTFFDDLVHMYDQMDLIAFEKSRVLNRQIAQLLFPEEVVDEVLQKLENIIAIYPGNRFIPTLPLSPESRHTPFSYFQERISAKFIELRDQIIDPSGKLFEHARKTRQISLRDIKKSFHEYLSDNSSSLQFTHTDAQKLLRGFIDTVKGRIPNFTEDPSPLETLRKARRQATKDRVSLKDLNAQMEELTEFYSAVAIWKNNSLVFNSKITLEENIKKTLAEIDISIQELDHSASKEAKRLHNEMSCDLDEILINHIPGLSKESSPFDYQPRINHIPDLSKESLPFHYQPRIHDILNRISDITTESSRFTDKFFEDSYQDVVRYWDDFYSELNNLIKRLQSTRSYALESLLIPYFTDVQRGTYLVGKKKSSKKALHENSVIQQTSQLFLNLNKTNELPYYINNYIDGFIEMILQEKLLALINHMNSLTKADRPTFEEAYENYRQYSLTHLEDLRTQIQKCRDLFFNPGGIEDTFNQFQACLNAIKHLPSGRKALGDFLRLYKELRRLFETYQTLISNFETASISTKVQCNLLATVRDDCKGILDIDNSRIVSILKNPEKRKKETVKELNDLKVALSLIRYDQKTLRQYSIDQLRQLLDTYNAVPKGGPSEPARIKAQYCRILLAKQKEALALLEKIGLDPSAHTDPELCNEIDILINRIESDPMEAFTLESKEQQANLFAALRTSLQQFTPRLPHFARTQNLRDDFDHTLKALEYSIEATHETRDLSTLAKAPTPSRDEKGQLIMERVVDENPHTILIQLLQPRYKIKYRTTHQEPPYISPETVGVDVEVTYKRDVAGSPPIIVKTHPEGYDQSPGFIDRLANECPLNLSRDPQTIVIKV